MQSYLLLILFFLMISAGCVSIPSDNEMERVFNANYAEFLQLSRMLEEDADLARLTWEGSVFMSNQSDRVLTVQRISAYRQLLSGLGLKGGVHRDDSSTVRLIVSYPVIGWPTEEKSYVVSPGAKEPLFDNLDSLRYGTGNVQAYKRLGEHWYLSYARW
jgi:hypothetical protein